MMPTQISSNLQLCSYAGGVKLIRPEDAHTGQFVGDIMSKSYNVYFLDTEHRINAINEPAVQSCGFNSLRDAIGNSMEKVLTRTSHAQLLFNHENQVMQEGRRFVFGQYGELRNGGYVDAVSTLWPWYDDDDKIIGTFGCAVVLQNKNLPEIASYMNDIQKLFPSVMLPDIRFSPREIDVIKLVMRGHPMRLIAAKLGLSARTVESYFANIKIKANVASKSELIEKYYDCF